MSLKLPENKQEEETSQKNRKEVNKVSWLPKRKPKFSRKRRNRDKRIRKPEKQKSDVNKKELK